MQLCIFVKKILILAYIKNCNICGSRISMRQMPQGQWIAFNVGSDTPHVHGVATENSKRIVATKKKVSQLASVNQKLDDTHIIDRSGEVYDLTTIPDEWMDLTSRNLKKLFNVIISNKRQAQILYIDRNGDSTNRKIYPLGLIQNNNQGRNTSKTLKIVGFCRLRQDYRTFSLESIEEIQVLNKIPKSFRKKFNSLSFNEKNKILNGTIFYGSNSKYSESDDTFSRPKKTKSRTKSINSPKSKQAPQRQVDHHYSESQNEDSGGCLWWFIGFSVFFWIVIL